MLTNKDKLFLANLQGSLKEFMKADVGKAAKEDLKAIEKAAGGKKKLEEADKVLADAEKSRKKILGKAESDAAKIISDAEGNIRNEIGKLAKVKADLDARAEEIERIRESVAKREQDIAHALEELRNRETLVKERQGALDRRAAELDSLERTLSERERKIERVEAWATARPA